MRKKVVVVIEYEVPDPALKGEPIQVISVAKGTEPIKKDSEYTGGADYWKIDASDTSELSVTLVHWKGK